MHAYYKLEKDANKQAYHNAEPVPAPKSRTLAGEKSGTLLFT